jgi:cysteine-rich repeat protein
MNDGTNTPTDCNVGSFFDPQQKKCLPCPDGCLKCKDCYTCETCHPDFNYDIPSKLCVEKCGDGRRYVLECDDGGNNPNDGCSRDCKIEPGYVCKGGSPTNYDRCERYNPT